MRIKFTQNQIPDIVKNYILPFLEHKTIFTFVGQLGAGKTTIIKEILKQCGITQNVTSPTFGYVNSYNAAKILNDDYKAARGDGSTLFTMQLLRPAHPELAEGVEPYERSNATSFNHFDLYRISSVDEFISAGFEELIYKPDNISLIEWPEVIKEILDLPGIKSKVCHIKISYTDEDLESRILEIK